MWSSPVCDGVDAKDFEEDEDAKAADTMTLIIDSIPSGFSGERADHGRLAVKILLLVASVSS